MLEHAADLGQPVSRHSISPAALQRAVIVAVMSFVFFLATLVAFYIRQAAGFFLLSTGFLVVYIFTLIGWAMQRRNVVTVYENGISYRKFRAAWSEIESVAARKDGLVLIKNRHERTVIPPSVNDYLRIIHIVKTGVEGES